MFFVSMNLDATELRYQSLGMSVSSYSGSGLSYRYHFQSQWAVQLTGGAIISGDEKNFATGLEFQRDLSSIKDKRLFLIFASGWYGDTQEVLKKGNLYETTKIDVSYYKLSVGFGGELAFGSSLVQNITLGIAIYPIGISIKEKHSFTDYDNTDEVNFGASLFTHFNF